MITERLMSVGQWSVQLSDETPRHILDLLRPTRSGFAHVVISPVATDADAVTGGGVRYSGVLRKRSGNVISGVGVAAWLGDEDGKGDVLATPTTASTFHGWVDALMPPSLAYGNISAIGGTLSKTFHRVTRRAALDEVCAAFGAEWVVRPDYTLSVGLREDLFRTTPRAVVVKRRTDAGFDPGLTGIAGDLQVEEDVEAWARSVLYYFDNNAQVHEVNGGVADIDVPFRDPMGGPATIKKVIESSTAATGEAVALAAAEYAAVKDGRRTLTLSADAYDIGADVRVGDDLWVYDPDAGLFTPSNPLSYHGDTIFPTKIRCVGYTWPVRAGMGVYLRRYVRQSGEWVRDWVDLTPYVVPEDGDVSVEVGASPLPVVGRSATPPGVTRDEYAKTLAKLEDTGWVVCPITPDVGFTGGLWVRRIGRVIHLRGTVTGAFTANATTTVATIPVDFRPLSAVPTPAIWTNGEYNWGNVTAGGTFNVRKTVTGSSTLTVGATWMI